MRIAQELGREVVITNVTLAELYRGRERSSAVDALLSREREGVVLRDTDRNLARLVGALLTQADLGSAHIADAHVAAAAVEHGGVVLTADPGDLEHLLAGASHVTVVALRDSRSSPV
jgi:predicted nucleic acid-binding protein